MINAVSKIHILQLAWSDLQIIRDVILVLASQGWEKLLNEDDESTAATQAIVRLGTRFKSPLTRVHQPKLKLIGLTRSFMR